MQSVELTKREIEVILAMLMNCNDGPIRLGNNAISVSYLDDIEPMIKKFNNMLCEDAADEQKEKLRNFIKIVIFKPIDDYEHFDNLQDIKEQASFEIDHFAINWDDCTIDASFTCRRYEYNDILDLEKYYYRPIALLSECRDTLILFPKVKINAEYSTKFDGFINIKIKDSKFLPTERFDRYLICRVN